MLARLGTDLLRVYPVADLQGTPTRLPATAEPMLAGVGSVTAASRVGELSGVGVYRSPYVPPGNTNSLVVAAVDTTLLATLHGTLAAGHWSSSANAAYPTVVLGSTAARRLAIEEPGLRVWIKDRWWVVVGILDPLPLALELDSAAILPAPAVRELAGDDGTGTAVYLRMDEHQVFAVSEVVPRTASPEHPDQVGIARPSDAITAQLAAEQTLNRLLIGLAAIGLFVGGVGVGNTMIIAVVERRGEIGLRRALGANRGNITIQFLAESPLMATIGGALGVVVGYLVAGGYARTQGWAVSLPLWVGAAAVAVTAGVGALAGLYPALAASRQSPTTALSAGT